MHFYVCEVVFSGMDLPTYVTSPPNIESSKGIVVIIPDAFGWNPINITQIVQPHTQQMMAKV